ncbi:MAG TPA: NIPSNAP family protein [Acidobacteriota bacterium]|jgi:hypothetical protein|nr:NIPSNAP family protein [Acidobacteriota bacterium]
MFQRTLLWSLLVAAGFLLGLEMGKARVVNAEAKTRVFEIRTYTANEGKLEALHARFRDHTTKLFKKHGMTNIGYWSPKDPPLSQNTLIYVLAFPSREAAKKSWEEFRSDPQWKKVQAESEANGKLVSKVESVFADPTDYSPIR